MAHTKIKQSLDKDETFKDFENLKDQLKNDFQALLYKMIERKERVEEQQQELAIISEVYFFS